MSFQAEAARIQRAAGDPFKVLSLARDASLGEVQAAYKRLALQFHPDRLSLPPHMSDQDKESMVQQATEAFKTISAAFLVLKDPEQRKAAKRQPARSEGGTMVPFSNRPTAPSSVASVVSRRSETMPSAPARRTSPRSASVYSGGSSRSPPEEAYYPEERERERGYDREPPRYGELYRDEPNDFDDRRDDYRRDDYDDPKPLARQPDGPADPFQVFNNMFGTDLFSSFGGGKGLMNQARRNDPFAMFDNMFGGGNNNNNNNKADPFSAMFDNLCLGNGAGRADEKPNPSRGAFATQRITRRHTSRNGDVSMAKHERSMGVFDMGHKGQMMVESSFSVQGFQPGRTDPAAGSLGSNMFGNSTAPRVTAAPHHARSMQDMTNDYERGGSDYDLALPPAPRYPAAPFQRSVESIGPSFERQRRLSDAYSSPGSAYGQGMMHEQARPRALAW